MKWFWLTVLLCCSMFCSGQEKKRLTIAQMTSDFDFLTAVLQIAHPSLYRYTPRDTLDKYARVTRARFNRPMTEIQFWFIVQHFVAAVRSGHTRLEPDDEFMNRYRLAPHEILPFHIYISGNRIFVKGFIRSGNTTILPNSEITAIDGESARELLNHYRTLVSGDGYNMSLKNYLLENGRFNFLYELAHPGKTQFKLALRTTVGKDTTVMVLAADRYVPAGPPSIATGGVPGEFRLKGMFPADTTEKRLLFDQNSGAVIVKLPDFSYANYLDFHKSLFAQIKAHAATKLFIDLRGNLGGRDFICADLLRYMIGKPFIFTRLEESRVEVSDFEEKNQNHDLLHVQNGFHSLRYPINETLHPYAERFKGRIYVIIDGGTYSSAALFAAALKLQTNCTLIGQESGGNLAGCDGGHIAEVILPGSKLRLFLPLLWTYSASTAPDDGHGIMPEIFLPVSAAALPYKALVDAVP
ncbi:S41 family peptidase [Mucilaginibacter sp. SMC90]|uniref:S41 family peptidase n=1 Tax=Mucilaginibacter sp. SMC90 TaxID=2929803 RepID=UPI001FB537F5|nr:S41 family peptidase [Mucilaginibacter sp. SMC90]UOE50916.1 S41 family peptidase [Mucilaginibacter sp. SMC90]